MKLIERIIVNRKGIQKNFLCILGACSSIWGVVSIFFDTHQKNNHLPIILLLLFCIIVLSFIVSVFYTLKQKERTILWLNGGKKVKVKIGDIFKGESPIRVIAVNRSFDTIVDQKLIAEESLHGKLIKYNLNNMHISELNKRIQQSLSQQGIYGTSLPKKSSGNVLQYPVGTIVELPYGETTYYLLALNEMDENYNTHCTIVEYCQAIICLLEYVNKNAQGVSVDIPVIGAGLSRLNISEQDLVALLISLIKTKRSQIFSSINIIVYELSKDSFSLFDV